MASPSEIYPVQEPREHLEGGQLSGLEFENENDEGDRQMGPIR